jgi:hypothetical protein
VTISSAVQDPRSGVWHSVPESARDPLPVYPAQALAQGLEGEVTVELPVRPTRSGLVPAGPPRISSSDPAGVLATAVARALERARGASIGAGLRAVSVYHNDIASPRPGSHLRLRTTYRFLLRTADVSGAAPPTSGG